MVNMFRQCRALKKLDLSSFHTNKVLDMSYMFYICDSLKELNVDNFINNDSCEVEFMFWAVDDDLQKIIRKRNKYIKSKAFWINYQ